MGERQKENGTDGEMEERRLLCQKESKPLVGLLAGLGHSVRPRTCKDSRPLKKNEEQREDVERRGRGNETDASTRTKEKLYS